MVYLTVYDIHVADIAIDYLKSCNDKKKKKHGDGSKPWYLVNIKIAGIYGCSSP